MAYTTINKSSEHFNSKLYVGNESTNAITGVGFQPDFVWMKNRQQDYYHGIYDSIRGTGTSKSLNSNSDETEGQNPGNLNLVSFDSNGFTVGATSGTNVINTNNDNHASWNWKASGSASSNSNGSITSSVSANQDAGFSIVSYTGNGTNGSSVGHGLGAVPQMLITKRLTSVDPWIVQHHQISATPWDDIYCVLNTTAARAGQLSVSGGYAPNVNEFYVGNDGAVNANGQNYITYCFTGKQGFSKFGSYVGNGSSDGVFCYTGFKPSFVITKAASASGQSWHMQDNKRDGFNYDNKRLFADSSSSESGTTRMDLLSNGFKYRDGDGNGTGITYIYMAFAEAPLVGTNNVPANAR